LERDEAKNDMIFLVKFCHPLTESG
jgi:hypothetical protein